jgi:hypothetical protein
MFRVNVADVEVKYRTVEVPDLCPMCGRDLSTTSVGERSAVRELNLASANFYGSLGRSEEDGGFTVDPASDEEHPSDAVWVVFAYECARCGELLATGSVDVQ